MVLPTISLCTGAGMLDRGFHLAMASRGLDARAICYCERDPYAAAILVARMEEKALDHAPVWSDLITFPVRRFAGKVACVVAGIPCQGHSLAGKRQIKDDPRNLWPQTRYILRYTEASIFALENVQGFLVPNRKQGLEAGIRRVIHDLDEDGWVGVWGTLRASDVGAAHKRERVFLLAYRENNGHEFRAWMRGNQRGGVPTKQISGGWSAGGTGEPGGCVGGVANNHFLRGSQDEQPAQEGGRDNNVCCGELAYRSSERRSDQWNSITERSARHSDPNSTPSPQRGEPTQRWREPGSVANPAGNTRSGGMLEQIGEENRGATLDGAGGELADCCGDGRGQGPEIPQGRQSKSSTIVEGFPLFAPARNDYAEWLRVLRIDPTLVPAFRRPERSGIPGDPQEPESELCRVADGLATYVDHRADRLRVCGNGVVWLQAAVAYAQLWDRLMKIKDGE